MQTVRIMREVVAVSLSVFMFGCTDAAAPQEATSETASPVTHLDFQTCVTTDAGVWNDGFIAQQYGHFKLNFGISAYPTPIDAVIGLGNVKAAKFTDMGPIVRLNEQGKID